MLTRPACGSPVFVSGCMLQVPNFSHGTATIKNGENEQPMRCISCLDSKVLWFMISGLRISGIWLGMLSVTLICFASYTYLGELLACMECRTSCLYSRDQTRGGYCTGAFIISQPIEDSGFRRKVFPDPRKRIERDSNRG